MRVMLSVSAWPTHYLSMVPLGWALQSAGHEVRVACAPSQTETLARAGLTPVPILTDLDMVRQTRLLYIRDARDGTWPYPWLPLHPVTGVPLTSLDAFDMAAYQAEHDRASHALLRRSCEAAVDFACRWRPELVLYDPVSFEGMLVARVLDVPGVVSLWGPVGTAEPPRLCLMPHAPDIFNGYGVTPTRLDEAAHVIDPCPAELAPPTSATRLPVRYIPYNGAGEMPPWLLTAPSRRRICVTLGSELTRVAGHGSFSLAKVLGAVTTLDCEVVVAATARDLATLPPFPNVRTLESFPLRLLLPTCSAIVHHGGAGTTMTALATGVPQLALTFGVEQHSNGTRLAATYAGLHLPAHQATTGAVTAAVTALLEQPGHAERAAALRSDLDVRPPPADLVPILEKLAIVPAG
ncbi:nucleotide disphospho-sugar-binding domain-containing protein [Amycolatopsis sp. lyj-90]|uniref:nucleotide disphospho-sugar-binding domain-containing protein n=1 Tax=Amycolatopsis sp. lyj-90 TaxID=2789285 RepID=UPI0039787F2F